MSTIKKVAKLAGVSTSSVSNYFNHPTLVSKATFAKIRHAIDEVGYKPNVTAKNLKSRGSSDIGVILPNLDDSYYVQIIQGIESVVNQSDYYLNLSFSNNNEETEIRIIDRFVRKQICGLILVPSITDNWQFYYHTYLSQNKPLVLLDREISNLDSNFISFNNKETISFLTEKLFLNNFSNIVLMTGPPSYTSEDSCIKGFVRSHDKCNRPLDTDRQVVHSGMSKEEAFRSAVDLFARTTPGAIITTSESSATGILECMAVLGFSTNNIPVVTLGEDHWDKNVHSKATISTNRAAIQMGRIAASTLIDQIEAPITNENKRIVLQDKILDQKNWNAKFSTEQSISIKKKSKNPIKMLLLDTMQVHKLTRLLKNFFNVTGIETSIETVPHHLLYQRISDIHSNYTDKSEIPDLFMFDSPWLYSLVNSNILENISEYIINQVVDRNLFLPGSLDYFGKYNDAYYALPFMFAPQILYYRKDLFNNTKLKKEFEQIFRSILRPPKTWREFNAICSFFTNFTDEIAYGTSIPAAYPEFLAPEIYLRIFSGGGRIFDKNNRVVINQPHNLRAYIHLLKTLESSKPNFAQSDDVSVVKDFLNGETAMLITYPAFINNTDGSHLKKGLATNIGFGQVPGQTPILGGWSLGISRDSGNKDNAFQFLKWACTQQTSDYLSLLGGFSAVESTYTNDELVKLYPWFPLYQSANKNARPIIPPRNRDGGYISQNLVDEIVCKGIYLLIEDSSDIPSTISKTQRELENLLSI